MRRFEPVTWRRRLCLGWVGPERTACGNKRAYVSRTMVAKSSAKPAGGACDGYGRCTPLAPHQRLMSQGLTEGR